MVLGRSRQFIGQRPDRDVRLICQADGDQRDRAEDDAAGFAPDLGRLPIGREIFIMRLAEQLAAGIARFRESIKAILASFERRDPAIRLAVGGFTRARHIGMTGVERDAAEKAGGPRQE